MKLSALPVAAIFAALASTLPAAVKTVATPPAIDGDLSDAVWQNADWETGFRRFRKYAPDRAVQADTSFAFLADAENVYLAVKCEEPDMPAVEAAAPRGIFSRGNNMIEFVLAPDGSDFEYYQFVATFRGETHAMFYSERGHIKPDPYGFEWEAKPGRFEKGWTLEIRIPLAAFYMTRASVWRPEWRVSVSRARSLEGYSSWCDFEKSFAEPQNYRRLAGFPIRRAEEDVWVKSVQANPSGNENGRTVGELKAVVYAAKPGRAVVETPFSGRNEVSLAAGEKEFVFKAVFPENGRHPLQVALTREGEKVTLKRIYPVIVDYEPIRVKLTSPQYRDNFYPGQKANRIAGRAQFAAGRFASACLHIPGLAEQCQMLPADGSFVFEIEDGAASWDGTLEVTCGDDVKRVRIRKLAPLPAGQHMSWIENGLLVVDGKPVFRLNMYAEYYRGGEAFRRRYDADDLYQTKDVRRIGSLEPGRLIKGLEQKEAVKDIKPCEALFAKVKEVVEAGRSSTNGVYYYISDEPECRLVSPVYLKWIYDYAKELDPYHVILSCSRAGERYIDCTDWIEAHPYVNPHFDKNGERIYGRDFNTIGAFVDNCHPEKHPDKCIGGAQGCFAYANSGYPTFEEYLLNTWCLLVRGAKSFFPYAYHDLGDCAQLYEGTRYINSSVQALSDFLLHGSRETLQRDEKTECALWTLGQARLLAVVNFTSRPQTATITGLSGSFSEFRGTRTFAFNVQPSTFNLQPHESLVLTTEPRGTGLPSFAEVKARIEAAEKARTNRGNLLFGRGKDIAISASSKTKPNGRKLFDGTLDVIAWAGPAAQHSSMELGFAKFTPSFGRLAVYGWHLKGMKVFARVAGEWKELEPAKRDSEEFHEILDFAEPVSAEGLRIEFARKNVELYEIELLKEGNR